VLHALTRSACFALVCCACDQASVASPDTSADASVPADAFAADAPMRLDVGPLRAWSERCPDELGLDEADCQRVAQLALPATLPASAGNRFADDERAAELGFRIFFDPKFSPLPGIREPLGVRCATCHLPEKSFADRLPTSEVIAGDPLTRNSPTIWNAAWSGPFYFWDGRADSLWSQPLFAFENPQEMNGSRLRVAHVLWDSQYGSGSDYRSSYEAIFGALPDLSDLARFPADGKPGEPAYEAMSLEDRHAVDVVAANVGKALEAYMRKAAAGRSALDRYLSTDPLALDAAGRRGLSAFVQRGCIDCHSGPALSDHAFHVPEGSSADRGRAAGIEVLLANPFNSQGEFFDRGVGAAPTLPAGSSSADEGAIRTPSLRNVNETAPFWHDGRYATVADVLSAHGARLSEQELNDVLVWMFSLRGTSAQRPWSDWPAI
jgi:cytochrome c peroxidase